MAEPLPEQSSNSESLIDAILQEAEAMERDFTGWLKRQAPLWRKLGHDETWIRLRMETAQATRKLNRLMKAQGYSEAERRQALRVAFSLPAAPAENLALPTAIPHSVQHAMIQLGIEIGATIFDVAPALQREEFITRVEFLTQHILGEKFVAKKGTRAQYAQTIIIEQATGEFERLGGVFREVP